MNRCDFSSLDYLRCGNDLQRRSYEMLEREGIFRKLAPYGPLLAGTIPICIDVEGSDLDIVCRTGDADGFALFANGKFDSDRIICFFVLTQIFFKNPVSCGHYAVADFIT